ncbi:MAG: hypothetical protein ACLP59_00580 [Bryobacteraceae bacterium]
MTVENKNRWPLALCAILDAIIAVIYFIMQSERGPMAFHAWHSMVALLGVLTVAAGAATIAAGIWAAQKEGRWLLAITGAALAVLGVIYWGFVDRRISFLVIALLIIVTALSAGVLELTSGHRWFGRLAGAASFGFAVVFLALGLGWIKLVPGSHLELLWLSCYFGFSAVAMLGLLGAQGGPGVHARGTAGG